MILINVLFRLASHCMKRRISQVKPLNNEVCHAYYNQLPWL